MVTCSLWLPAYDGPDVEIARRRVRARNESLRGFCYAMQRICSRSPVALGEHKAIRYLLLGLKDEAAENALVAAQPQNLAHFYELVKALKMHKSDRGNSGSRYRRLVVGSDLSDPVIPLMEASGSADTRPSKLIL